MRTGIFLLFLAFAVRHATADEKDKINCAFYLKSFKAVASGSYKVSFIKPVKIAIRCAGGGICSPAVRKSLIERFAKEGIVNFEITSAGASNLWQEPMNEYFNDRNYAQALMDLGSNDYYLAMIPTNLSIATKLKQNLKSDASLRGRLKNWLEKGELSWSDANYVADREAAISVLDHGGGLDHVHIQNLRDFDLLNIAFSHQPGQGQIDFINFLLHNEEAKGNLKRNVSTP